MVRSRKDNSHSSVRSFTSGPSQGDQQPIGRLELRGNRKPTGKAKLEQENQKQKKSWRLEKLDHDSRGGREEQQEEVRAMKPRLKNWHPKFTNEEFDIMLSWFEVPSNWAKVFVVEGRTRRPSVPQGWKSCADNLVDKTGERFVGITGIAIRARFTRYKMLFLSAKIRSGYTGFGITNDDVKRGVNTTEEKLENMFHGYRRMEALLMKKVPMSSLSFEKWMEEEGQEQEIECMFSAEDDNDEGNETEGEPNDDVQDHGPESPNEEDHTHTGSSTRRLMSENEDAECFEPRLLSVDSSSRASTHVAGHKRRTSDSSASSPKRARLTTDIQGDRSHRPTTVDPHRKRPTFDTAFWTSANARIEAQSSHEEKGLALQSTKIQVHAYIEEQKLALEKEKIKAERRNLERDDDKSLRESVLNFVQELAKQGKSKDEIEELLGMLQDMIPRLFQ
ncbi:hypothetical protein BGZ65_009501 [Modicella reniformis]|uniref:Uncharacterized protein n=1 Tax=Modicella reniformis TaxID=1440133 RepID=A0A9P6MBW6_9FUNG|nr:hypothetical protein BGZ65_009501 [Modicella reniformis]